MNDYTDIDLMLDEGDEEDAYYAAAPRDPGATPRSTRRATTTARGSVRTSWRTLREDPHTGKC